MSNFGIPNFPSPNVFYANCHKCGRKVNSKAEQHAALCGRCKKAAEPNCEVDLKIGNEQLVLIPHAIKYGGIVR